MIKFKLSNFLLLISLSMSFLSSCTVFTPKSDLHTDLHERQDFQEILDMLDDNEIMLANIALKNFINKYPHSYKTSVAEIEILRKQHRCSDATTKYKQFIAPSNMKLQDKIRTEENILICEVLENQSYTNDRINYILKNDATRWKAINSLGIKEMQQKHYDNAIIYFEIAKNLSNDPSIINNLSLAYVMQDKLIQAQQLLEDEIKQEIQSISYQKKFALNLSLIYFLQKKNNDAQSILLKFFDEDEAIKIINVYKSYNSKNSNNIVKSRLAQP